MGAQHEHENHTGYSDVDEHMNHDAHRSHADRELRNVHRGIDGHAAHSGHGDHSGHDDHAGHSGHGDHVAQFRRLFWVMLIFAIPVIAFSPMFGHLVGYEVPEIGILGWLRWLSPILGTIMYFWGGKPFLTGGLSELKDRNPGMMLLIALAITVAFLSSWGSSLGVLDAELDFWWELALLVVIMLAGHWLEMRSLAQTSSALDSLAALLPDEAEAIVDGETKMVDPAELELGDTVVVRPGAAVPADGRVIDGSASMDESMVTGESTTVRRSTGDTVVAGTVATDSGLRLEITATGDDTALAGIAETRRRGAGTRPHAPRGSPIRLRPGCSGSPSARPSSPRSCGPWWVCRTRPSSARSPSSSSPARTPWALAIPLVVSIATERAARAGVLIKDRLALETMRTVDTVLFDKTGTLTMGEPTVSAVETVDTNSEAGNKEDDILALAAAAETDSEHPLARAIARAAEERGLDVPTARNFSSSPAVGVAAEVNGAEVAVGGPYLLSEHGVSEARSLSSGAGRAPSSSTSSPTATSLGRSNSPMRSDRNPAKPSTLCTRAGQSRHDHR